MTTGTKRGFTLTIRLGFGRNRATLLIQQGRSMPKYHYEVARAAQILAYFALRTKTRSLNILKAMKLVYLSDRESIRLCGEPLLEEPRFALPRGPVNHMTYELAGARAGHPVEWTRYLYSRGEGNDITVRGNVGFSALDELSESDIECLDKVWRDFGWMEEHVLCAWTHKPENVPEWSDPKGGRLPITLESMMTALAIPNARRRAEDLEHQGNLKQLVEATR